MRLCVLLLSFAIASASSAQYAGAKPVAQVWKRGFDAITEDKARSLVGKLAGPDFRGRNPVNGDYNLAAGWLIAQLEALGLKPGGDNGSFFHRFVVWDTTPIPSATLFKSADGQLTLPFGSDFSVMAMGDNTWQLPKFAFLNVPRGSDWSSLDLSQLKDRWVFLTVDAAENGDLRKRLNGTDGQAKPGQLGTYVSNGRKPDQVVQPVKTQSVKDLPDPRRTPVFAVSLSARAIEQIATKCGATRFLQKTAQPSLELSNEQFVIEVKVSSVEFPMVNVIAKLEGSDPVLQNEAIVIGSHLDHLGPQRRGTYYGADDNASGCSANYLIAQAMTANPTKPKRSVYFCFWSSEELGLFGSYAFVQRPSIDLKNIAAYINMDMVGRNENDPRFKEKPENNTKSVYPSGVAFNSPDFLKVLFDVNQHVKLTLKPDVEDRIMRSDSGSFAWKEIPTVKVFTGDHEDYHQPGDTPEKVNYEKMTNIAKWLYLAVETLASGAPRPAWVATPFKANPWTLEKE